MNFTRLGAWLDSKFNDEYGTSNKPPFVALVLIATALCVGFLMYFGSD